MKLLSWNVNGIRAIAKKGFIQTVRDLAPDVLCLQEIKAGSDMVTELTAPLEGYSVFVNPAEKKVYSGTAILSRKKPLSVEAVPVGVGPAGVGAGCQLVGGGQVIVVRVQGVVREVGIETGMLGLGKVVHAVGVGVDHAGV